MCDVFDVWGRIGGIVKMMCVRYVVESWWNC